jgi:predicted amidophosphoribosyltransferase
MYCGKCGKKIKAGSQFCEHCGNPVPPQAPKQKTILPVIIIYAFLQKQIIEGVVSGAIK